MDYWRADDAVVDTAALVAEAAAAALRAHGTIHVSLVDLRGVTSSFVNVVIQRIAGEFGPAALSTRLIFDTANRTQRDVIASSMEALLSSK